MTVGEQLDTHSNFHEKNLEKVWTSGHVNHIQKEANIYLNNITMGML